MKPDAAFLRLIEVMAKSHDAESAPPSVAAEGIDEIEDHLDMLVINDDAGDSAEVMLQNCAALVGAAHRLAAVLLKDIKPERLPVIIAENQV